MTFGDPGGIAENTDVWKYILGNLHCTCVEMYSYRVSCQKFILFGIYIMTYKLKIGNATILGLVSSGSNLERLSQLKSADVSQIFWNIDFYSHTCFKVLQID